MCYELFLGSLLNPVQYFNTMCKAWMSDLGTKLKVGKNPSNKLFLFFHALPSLQLIVQNNTFEY